MKNFTTVKALALSLLCALPAATTAKHYEDREYYRDEESCCPSPLYPCGWSLEVHGGIAPILWNNRDCFQLANPYFTDGAAQLTPLGQLPKFRHLYKLPWDVGFRIGYTVCEKVEATFEFDYRQARSHCTVNTCTTVPTVSSCNTSCNTSCDRACDLPFALSYTNSTITDFGVTTLAINNLSRYKSYNGYVGARWYTERYWCDSVAFYFGIKVGFSVHKAIEANILQTNVLTDVTRSSVNFPTPLFYRNTTISAGGIVGLDYCFWNRLSFVFQVDFLGQGPLRANHNLGNDLCNNDCNTECNTECDTSCNSTVATPVDLSVLGAATTNLVGANFNTEVVFPILFGLKYYF